MVKILGLDIPPGLEEAFFSILGFPDAVLQTALRATKQPTSRFRSAQIFDYSLINLWAPLFDSFTLMRRNAWHAYWGGWPGSGFSAFIEVNAPRYRLGLDLLLDPPSTGNLWLFGDFHAGDTGWDIPAGFFVAGGALHFDPLGPLNDALMQEAYAATLVDGLQYRFEFDFSIVSGACHVFLYNRETAHVLDTQALGSGVGHHSYDFFYASDSNNTAWIPFIETDSLSLGQLDNFSLTQL